MFGGKMGMILRNRPFFLMEARNVYNGRRGSIRSVMRGKEVYPSGKNVSFNGRTSSQTLVKLLLVTFFPLSGISKNFYKDSDICIKIVD